MRNPIIVITLLLALGAGACAPTLAPLFAPVATAGISATGEPYTAEQVDRAALAGAQAKGWTIVQHTPGVTIAEVSAGGHTARVRILTNESGWRIVHEQSSPGLKHGSDERHGEVIHRRYNHWVRLLDDAIRQQLAQLPAPAPAPVAPETLPPTMGAAEPVPAAPAAP